MIPRWIMMAFWMLVEALSARRDARIRFLQAQLDMAHARLPGNRFILSPEERQKLLRLGSALQNDVNDALRSSTF